MKIQLKIDPDRLTLDDMIELESSENASWKNIKRLVTRYVTNEEGEYLPDDEAKELVGKLTISQINDAMNALREKMRGIQDEAVPPETA